MARKGSRFGSGFFGIGNRNAPAAQSAGDPIERQVNNRRSVEREELAEDESADDGDSERTAELRACACTESERKASEHGRERGHDDGAEAKQRGLVDGVGRR